MGWVESAPDWDAHGWISVNLPTLLVTVSPKRTNMYVNVRNKLTRKILKSHILLRGHPSPTLLVCSSSFLQSHFFSPPVRIPSETHTLSLHYHNCIVCTHILETALCFLRKVKEARCNSCSKGLMTLKLRNETINLYICIVEMSDEQDKYYGLAVKFVSLLIQLTFTVQRISS